MLPNHNKQLDLIVGKYSLDIREDFSIRLEEIRFHNSVLRKIGKDKLKELQDKIKDFVINTRKENPYCITSIVWFEDVMTQEYVMRIGYKEYEEIIKGDKKESHKEIGG